MLKQVLATAATTALLAVVPTAVAAADATSGSAAGSHSRGTASITGKWKGGVYGDNGGSAGYPAKVAIAKRHGTLHGRVVYPGACSGKWVYKGKKHGWFTFREVITRDPGKPTCVSPVAVKTRREGTKLRVVWREPATGDTGHMLAKRI
jgi:hypothetical protein